MALSLQDAVQDAQLKAVEGSCHIYIYDDGNDYTVKDTQEGSIGHLTHIIYPDGSVVLADG